MVPDDENIREKIKSIFLRIGEKNVIENIKYLLFIVLYQGILFISKVFSYIVNLFVHPLRNISL